jgi:hypothetical protein
MDLNGSGMVISCGSVAATLWAEHQVHHGGKW